MDVLPGGSLVEVQVLLSSTALISVAMVSRIVDAEQLGDRKFRNRWYGSYKDLWEEDNWW